MGVASGILLFVCIWFVVIFTVLPWGVRPSENPEAGHEVGAPERPRLFLKVLVTTGISIFLWGALYLLISNEVITIRPN